jgi:hypothetical protein
MHHHLEHPAHRIACPQRHIDLGLHLRLGIRVHAVQQNLILRQQRLNLIPTRRAPQLRSAHANHMARDLDTQFPQQQLRHRPAGYASRALARTRPLQHIPRIGEIVLQAPGQIRMSGTRACHGFMLRRIARLHRQNLFPVLPVVVCDRHRHRRPDRLPVPHPAEDMRRVALNPHPPATPITFLPSPHLAVDERLVYRHSRRQPTHQRHQRLAVALSRRRKPQHQSLSTQTEIVTRPFLPHPRQRNGMRPAEETLRRPFLFPVPQLRIPCFNAPGTNPP